MAKRRLSELKQALRTAVAESMPDNHIGDEELLRLIDDCVLSRQDLKLEERLYLQQAVFNSFRRLDMLSELLDEPTVTEIMINAYDEIFIEKNGRMLRWEQCFESEEQLEELIRQIAARINRMINTAHPIVDARLEDGSRVHCVLPPLALKGACMTIRKFPEPITMEKLIRFGSISEEAAEFLRSVVAAGYNIFISGGTGSGKTTFLNALSEYIPPDERVITIEDSAELQLKHIPNLVSLETRNANSEGEGAVSIAMLIRAALRMAPRRIIVGEVRGGECLDMLHAMNTGHPGSLSTGHGNSCKDMLRRMETMVLMAAELPLPAIRGQIASAIEIMVHLGRLRDRKRRVLEISEITGVENGEIQISSLFSFEEGRLVAKNPLQNTDKLSG